MTAAEDVFEIFIRQGCAEFSIQQTPVNNHYREPCSGKTTGFSTKHHKQRATWRTSNVIYLKKKGFRKRFDWMFVMFEKCDSTSSCTSRRDLGDPKQLGEDLICANVWLKCLERHPPPKQKVLVKKSLQSDKIPDISPFAFKIYISWGKRKGAIWSWGWAIKSRNIQTRSDLELRIRSKNHFRFLSVLG